MIRNKLQSTVLGKEESRDLDNLTIQDGKASFELPCLGEEMLEKTFGNISEVGIEVIENRYLFSFFENIATVNKVRVCWGKLHQARVLKVKECDGVDEFKILICSAQQI